MITYFEVLIEKVSLKLMPKITRINTSLENMNNIPKFQLSQLRVLSKYSKTCLKQPLSKRPKIVFQDQLSLNAGQKYCRMLKGEHSAILSTFIELPFVIKGIVLSIFEWPLKTGFTVCKICLTLCLLVSSADNLCKQFGPRSGQTVCRA